MALQDTNSSKDVQKNPLNIMHRCQISNIRKHIGYRKLETGRKIVVFSF